MLLVVGVNYYCRHSFPDFGAASIVTRILAIGTLRMKACVKILFVAGAQLHCLIKNGNNKLYYIIYYNNNNIMVIISSSSNNNNIISVYI